MKEGVLTQVHPAFSHDNLTERKGRLYFISDLIADKPKDIVQALQINTEEKKQQSVHVFYCGPALGIPETIQASMAAAIANDEDVGMGDEEAREFMNRLVREEDRFHTECF